MPDDPAIPIRAGFHTPGVIPLVTPAQNAGTYEIVHQGRPKAHPEKIDRPHTAGIHAVAQLMPLRDLVECGIQDGEEPEGNPPATVGPGRAIDPYPAVAPPHGVGIPCPREQY